MTPDPEAGSLVGRQIGGYQVLALLGAGGVGEVYRARDTRLGRDVALKVLQRDRADDALQQARFMREAQAAGSLSHPNIIAVYDVGVDAGRPFIVSEFVDGATLRAVIERAPLSIREVLRLSTQIADGLTAAHEAGIVHRDLKPDNIMVTRAGQVKILDFGLAKTPPPRVPSDPSALPPTRTETGFIHGTAAYMSPEQARGASVDFRSDQFSFGLVLYEMATGARAFQRDSAVQTLSAIITDEPRPATDRNPRVPAPLGWLIERCLAKNPGDRYAATRDLAQDLATLRDRLIDATSTAARRPGAPLWRPATRVVVVVAMLASLAMAIVWSRSQLAATALRPYRFEISPPDGSAFDQSSAFMTVSPDGRSLAFVASSRQGNNTLWVRSLDSLAARQLPDTDGAAQPFWSPDSRFLAFVNVVGAERKARKIHVSSGLSQLLGDSLGSGTWNRDDVLVVPSPRRGGGLYRVPAAGESVVPVTALDASRAETSHAWPHFLPDGRHFLYLARSRQPEYDSVLFVGSIDSAERTPLFQADSHAVYVAPGYLLFMRANTLLAQPFDAARLRLTGEPVLIADQVERTSGSQRGAFSVSQTGDVLAYRTIGETELTWFDRTGQQLESIGPSAHYGNPALSPDERRVAVGKVDRATGTSDIWLMDAARGVPSQFTFDPSEDMMPLWSADGSRIVFRSNRRSVASQPMEPGFYEKTSNGVGADELLLAGISAAGAPLGWSRDGALVYQAWGDPPLNVDLRILPAGGARHSVPLLQTPFNERQGQLSPDGRWMAYVSDESSQNEVYVRPFPTGEGQWKVSTNGGVEPTWRRDGRELFYLAPDRALMSVAMKTMKTGSTLEADAPVRLFETRMSTLTNPGYTRNQYVVSADGGRFLINQPASSSPASPITVVLNWTALLKR